jgi:hypothetical protein
VDPFLRKYRPFRKVCLFAEYYNTNRTLTYLHDPVGFELTIPLVMRFENVGVLVYIYSSSSQAYIAGNWAESDGRRNSFRATPTFQESRDSDRPATVWKLALLLNSRQSLSHSRISQNFRNPKVHYRVYKSHPLHQDSRYSNRESNRTPSGYEFPQCQRIRSKFFISVQAI